MTGLDRRQFLRAAGMAGVGTAGISSLSACGGGQATGGSQPQQGQTGSGKAITTPKLALSSTTQAGYLPQIAGPLLYGADFGLNYSKDDIVVFQSHATAIQAALSGDVQAVGASTMGVLAALAQGTPFKLFTTYILVGDYVLAGAGDVDKIKDLQRPDVVLGIDSPGGAARSALDAILLAVDAGFLVEDLSNIKVLESSGLRTSALASGQVGASMIHKTQFHQIESKSGGDDFNIIQPMAEAVPKYLKEVYAAPKDWLENNTSSAAALTASIIKASREMSSSFKTFRDAAQEVLREPPPTSQLKSVFDVVQKYRTWPVKAHGVSPDRVEFMINLGVEEGILRKGAVSPRTAIDPRPLAKARKMLESA